ncbi:MAG: thiamine diphosphokinase [Oscillospiraceae bacterium]|nr:thiamine diphosphokinase [Oscillospiraceae bacterium]MDE7171444.1 thiamine diphosphokinase [Oscillospiraceae bacterium]
MKRCVIIGGADIRRYDRIRTHLHEDDFYICCDSGLKHREALGIVPNLIIGDFDSHENPYLDIETIILPCEKDDTDTVFAAKEALRRGFQDFLLVGVIGGRLDHTLGNVSILLMLDAQGRTASAVDDFSEMEIISNKPVKIDDRYAYFSLLNVTGIAQGITIKNAKYPLTNAEIKCEYQYGISNEVLPGMTAEVSLENGKLLLIKVLP